MEPVSVVIQAVLTLLPLIDDLVEDINDLNDEEKDLVLTLRRFQAEGNSLSDELDNRVNGAD